MAWDAVVFFVGMLAGSVAAISGFGIGSLLTPLLALHFETQLAVALVSVPHLIGTSARFLSLKEGVHRRVFISFGILSAIGGLAGALLHSRAKGPLLEGIFGGLLAFAGISGLSGFADRMHFGRRMAWFAGGLSGLFGGLVGNQGGIRSAALLGFDVSKVGFVATATAIGLIVDAARVPVYFATQGHQILEAWVDIITAVFGVLVGTFGGVRLLRLVPQRMYRKLVSALILALGVYFFLRVLRGTAVQ